MCIRDRPEGLRLQVETGGLFAPDWCPSAPEPWLPTLRRAIRGQRVLKLAYADAGNRVSQRTIWPFAMAFLDDRRLLAAWCELRGDFRHFRADRVLGLEDTGRGYPETRHGLLRRWRAQEQLRKHEPVSYTHLDVYKRQGVVIGKKNAGLNSAFTVRKISHGFGVERVFQTHSATIDSVEVKRRGAVRASKLYYLRGLEGKKARIKEDLAGNAKALSLIHI